MKSIPTLVALAAATSLVLATGAFAQEAQKPAPSAEKKSERHEHEKGGGHQHGERRGHGCGGMQSHS